MDIDDQPSSSSSAASSRPKADSFQQFALSAIIEADREDAKCVVEAATVNNGTLISGGRDGILKYWEKQNGHEVWENRANIMQKDCLCINSLAFGALRTSGWECLVFVGRKSGAIEMYDPVNPADPIKVLQGHKSNVCVLHFDEDTGLLLSGSWDHNAVVWPVEQLLSEEPTEVGIGVLDGHKNSVWAVATVPSKPTKFLTGSADKSIKLWSNNYQEIGLYLGHQDVVRAILVLSEFHFLSTANDATIMLWDVQNGNRIRTFLPQHDQYIYTMTRLNILNSSLSLIITGGEQGLLDIWKLGNDGATLEHKQSIKVPVMSIWNICPLKNGDFAIAASSGLVLIYTSVPSREAPDDIKEFFYAHQYEQLAAKERETQNAKNSSFDMSRFSASTAAQIQQQQNGGGSDENGGLFSGGDGGKPSSTFLDPFTGSGRYIPGAGMAPIAPVSIDKKRPRNHLVPLNDFYKFGLDGLSKKLLTRLHELNAQQQNWHLKLNEEEFGSLEQIITESDFNIEECQIVGLEKGIQWPIDAIPVLGNPPRGRQTIGQLLALLTNPDSPEAVRILCCRALTNAANHEFGQAMLLSEMANFCVAVSKQLISSSKASLQISAASALANFSRILLLKKEEEAVTELGPREDALRAIILGLQKEQRNFGTYSPIAILRLLQTIIMLMWGQSTLIYLAMELELATILKGIMDGVADENVKILVRDALEMLQAM